MEKRVAFSSAVSCVEYKNHILFLYVIFQFCINYHPIYNVVYRCLPVVIGYKFFLSQVANVLFSSQKILAYLIT